MKTERYALYSRFERIWHWCQAVAILAMILTGVAIHWPMGADWLPFAWAVHIHNAAGFVLIANAFFGFFYFLATGSIRQYVPRRREFVSSTGRQMSFYLRGIFRGERHPIEKVPERRLNPLQQITYLMVLNVLLPLQMATGLLMWSAASWPEAAQTLGGLGFLGLVHTFGAWCFCSFLMMHLYLITTGHTPSANLKAMVLGYEDVPVEEN